MSISSKEEYPGAPDMCPNIHVIQYHDITYLDPCNWTLWANIVVYKSVLILTILLDLKTGNSWPDVDGGEAESDEQGDQWGADPHVPGVSDSRDDEKQESSSQHLVHSQGHQRNLQATRRRT